MNYFWKLSAASEIMIDYNCCHSILVLFFERTISQAPFIGSKVKTSNGTNLVTVLSVATIIQATAVEDAANLSSECENGACYANTYMCTCTYPYLSSYVYLQLILVFILLIFIEYIYLYILRHCILYWLYLIFSKLYESIEIKKF